MAQVTTRFMEITTPLGEDVLLFHAMHAREELSCSSEFQLDLLSKQHDIDIDKILGQNVTIKLELPDDGIRYFNGFVTRFGQMGMHGRYHRFFASVRPWTWFLTRTADCRVFQDKTVREIVEEVFADHAIADFAFELTEQYRKWTYCVQYRETDFNFISRLLEHEGIYYYFRHTDGHHKLVLTDSASKLAPTTGYETIKLHAREDYGRPGAEYISQWHFAREVQPGAFVHTDYDLARPGVDLRTEKTLPRTYSPSDYEIFDYPGAYVERPDGERYAGIRIEEFGSQYELAHAVANARGVSVGSLFTLEGCSRAEQNCEYVILSSTYDLLFSDYEGMPENAPPSYQCRFTAMSSQQQFRPRRVTPKPFVQGPQTAVVVGPAGEEIYTDEYGRVKVQFHWDRYGKKDAQSSCWIRVSQPWAGKGWGSVATPRIGQEVIVDFLEGDPDQPIVTGRVYNAGQQPPFGFPAGAVVSGIKSKTHKGSGYNEISCDDTAGKEKITIHAQYDMNTTVEHDQTIDVNTGNRAMTVKSGTLTDTIKGNASLTVQAGSRTVSVTGGDYDASASQAVKLHGKGAGVQVTGDAAGVSVKGTGGTGVGINGTPNVELVAAAVAATEAPVVTVKGTASCLVESPLVSIDAKATGILKSPIVDIGDGVVTIHGASIVLSAGSGAIEIGAAGVTINGGAVNISGGTVNVVGGLVKIN